MTTGDVALIIVLVPIFLISSMVMWALLRVLMDL